VTNNVPFLQVGMKVINDDGTPVEWFRNAWNALLLRTGTETDNSVGGIISGAAELQAQIAAEAAARIAGDAAIAAAAAGSSGGTSNANVFSGGVSSGATWVSICTVTLTPTGAGGDYSITILSDLYISGGLSDDGGASAVSFAGNWRIIEELTGGGTEHTLESGTFSVDYAPAETFSEGGIPYTVGPFWTTAFTGLPLTAVLIPANEGAQVDIRFEIQRASGTNEITSPGLSGSMTVVWTA
jgi:hypothetical protein